MREGGSEGKEDRGGGRLEGREEVMGWEGVRDGYGWVEEGGEKARKGREEAREVRRKKGRRGIMRGEEGIMTKTLPRKFHFSNNSRWCHSSRDAGGGGEGGVRKRQG